MVLQALTAVPSYGGPTVLDLNRSFVSCRVLRGRCGNSSRRSCSLALSFVASLALFYRWPSSRDRGSRAPIAIASWFGLCVGAAPARSRPANEQVPAQLTNMQAGNGLVDRAAFIVSQILGLGFEDPVLLFTRPDMLGLRQIWPTGPACYFDAKRRHLSIRSIRYPALSARQDAAKDR